jgi:protein-L-isoaspartate(D-aspartate) O-methyltransferase
MTMLDERPATARRAMIDSQLRVSGVNDPAVLAALNAVPRENYVPAALRANAYIDRALPLDNGHALAAPLVQGRMLIEAAPQVGEKVLVISASGYLAALVKAMGASVTLLAPTEAIAKKKGGPYNLILIDGAAEELPAGIATMLAADGRLITGTVAGGVTGLALGRRTADGIALLALAEIGMPVLPEFAATKRWSF